MKSRKNLIIFIIGLRNKLQCCGASVASAAGPFTTKNKRAGGINVSKQKEPTPNVIYQLSLLL
jgi:hypothetical protein